MLPVTIEAAEISQAFATGVAESMVSSGATGYDRKVWESLNYFYEVDAWLPRNYVMVNSDSWNGASDASKAVMTAAVLSWLNTPGTGAPRNTPALPCNGLRAGGMTVGPAGDKLVGELNEARATMTNEWLEAAGDEGQAIIDAFKACSK